MWKVWGGGGGDVSFLLWKEENIEIFLKLRISDKNVCQFFLKETSSKAVLFATDYEEWMICVSNIFCSRISFTKSRTKTQSIQNSAAKRCRFTFETWWQSGVCIRRAKLFSSLFTRKKHQVRDYATPLPCSTTSSSVLDSMRTTLGYGQLPPFWIYSKFIG